MSELASRNFDIIIIGGGVFGACAAWEASLRGASVALLERGDFCEGTSANSFKMVHGGIRYLQHLDFRRMRQSSNERRALLRIAPHLVQPLPVVIPTYGRGMQGKLALRTGCAIYDLVTCDRNRGNDDPDRRIPPVQSLSRRDCLQKFPGLDPNGLTGGVVFSDGQVQNPPRLVLSFVRSAAGAGAEAANYVEATGLLRRKGRVTGVRVRDVLGGAEFDVRGRVVVNAAGPWAAPLLKRSLRVGFKPPVAFSRDACFIVPRRLTGSEAIAVPGRTRDPDAVVSRSKRHLFLVPWKNCTLVGVWHVVHNGDPDGFTVTAEELEEFIAEINEAYPAAQLTLDDISMWNAGLVLFGTNEPGTRDLSYGKRSRIVDHAAEDGLEGLISLVGVRLTTARVEAERAVRMAFHKMGRTLPRSVTAETPLYGGDVGRFREFLSSRLPSRPASVDSDTMANLLSNHGSAYLNVVQLLDENASWAERLDGSLVIKAEIVHGVREEMAQRLADVVLRRTDLGTAGPPSTTALQTCAELMATELEWSADRVQEELQRTQQFFEKRCPRAELTAPSFDCAGTLSHP